jgi:hypothetical protein
VGVDKVRLYFTLVVDIMASVLLGFLCVSFLLTRVIYPVAKHDQQLLKSWGIEMHYGTLLTVAMLIPMFIAIYVHYKSLNRVLDALTVRSESRISHARGYLQLAPVGIAVIVIIFQVLEWFLKWVIFRNPYVSSTVISSLLLYPTTGYIIGQTLAKLTRIVVWEYRNSAGIYWVSSDRLIRQPHVWVSKRDD